MLNGHIRILRTSIVTLAAALFVGAAAHAQQTAPTGDHAHEMPMPMAKKPMPMTTAGMMTTAQKIANAASAAPASVSDKAAILDWPAEESGKPVVLRKGTNGWSCFPDMPQTEGNDPMCLDGPWMKWLDAYTAKTTPAVGSVGIGYMVAAGGAWGSNSDPYAMAKMANNEWGLHDPHVMIVVPDVKSLEGISTDPANGGPYVMWAGTPYAHIMAPVKPATTGMETDMKTMGTGTMSK